MEDVGLDALELLEAPGVANKLKISEREARRLIAAGKIRSVKIGRLVRVAPVDLAAYIEELRAEAVASAQGAA